MAIIPSALSPISNSIDNIFPDKYLVRMQEILIRSGMYVKASDLLTLIFGAGIISGHHRPYSIYFTGCKSINRFYSRFDCSWSPYIYLDFFHDGKKS